MTATPALDALFALPDALGHGPEADQRFLDAMREAFAHHYADCEVYRKVCDKAGFTPDSLQSMEDVPRVPWIMVNVFKKYDLTSIPASQIAVTYTSSGTTGQKSHISWDADSRDRQERSRHGLVESFGLTDDTFCNYMIFSYSPEVSEGKGAAFAHRMYASFAPSRNTEYAIIPGPDGEAAFDERRCADILEAYAEEDAPLRITGFPAFALRTLRELEYRGVTLDFSDESLLFHGGGWKSLATEAVTPQEYREAVERVLGVPRSRVRDVYGFVEHGIPYMTCEEGHFHVPVYSRMYARRPGSLELLPEGEPGLAQAVSPYNWAQPNISILSTDLLAVKSGCSCGRPGQYLELHGRAGVAKHQGCALTATELLRKVK